MTRPAPDSSEPRSGRPPRRRRRRAGIFVLLSAALFGLAALLGVLALSGTPIEAPHWVTERVQARINDKLGANGRITIGEIEIAVDRKMVPRLRMRNVGVFDRRGVEMARLNELGVRLAAPALLKGTLELNTLRVGGAQITVRRLSDGTFDLSLGSGFGATGTLGSVLDRIEAVFAAAPLAELSRIEAAQLTITLEDARSGRLWQVTEGRIVLEQGAGSIAVTVTADVFNGTEDLAHTVVELRSNKGSSAASLEAVFENAAAADIAAQSPALAFLEVLDAPIAGSLGAEIGPDGVLRRMTASLEIGEGALQPTPEARPIQIDAASARVSFDAASERLDFESVSLTTGAARGHASGQAYLKDFVQGFPETLVGQMQLTDVVLQPEGFFAAPLAFGSGAVDFRLRLNPFTVEIGQLALIDEGGRLLSRGEVAADARGWSAAVDLDIRRVGLDRLLALWPLAVGGNSRDWVAKHVSAGRVERMTGAFRLNPEQPKGQVSLSFAFADTVLKPMKTLPPITGAAGYASLAGNAFRVVLEEGRVAAPQGGTIDLAGSHMSVADVTAKPGRAALTLKTDSRIEAALSLLDLPPFGLLARAELTPDQAEGRAVLSSDIAFDLLKQVRIEDVDYSVSGRLKAFSSATLVKGRELSAETLEIRANPSGIAISGEGRMGTLPANVVWSQQFGPEEQGRSIVEGTVALGQGFLDEFNIGLPDGALTGEGAASITVELQKDAPPQFRLVSDLNRLGLRLPALNWSKARNAVGRLEVTGTLGEAPAIDRLTLEAPGLSASGTIELTDTGAMARASFDRVRVGGWLDGPVTLTGRGAGAAPAVTVRGGMVDLRAASFGAAGGSGGGGGGPLTLQLNRLIVSEGIAFTDFNGQFETRRGLQGRFTARINGGAPVNGSVVATPSGSAVRLISDDAGGAVASAGVLSNARGGSLDLTLNPTGREGVYDGYLTVRGTKIVRAPAITDLLNAISIVGLIDQMNSGGITMTEVEARFVLTPSRLTLLRSSGVGPSLGLSLDGVYDLTTGRMDMQGVVSPVYFLNGIGQVFSRRGEGLFGFSFRINGTSEDPRVKVNPLSILTPGMFREIFRRPPPQIRR